MITHVGVNHVGEVNGCRASRQRYDFSFGCKNINGIWKQINLDVLKKLARISILTLNVE